MKCKDDIKMFEHLVRIAKREGTDRVKLISLPKLKEPHPNQKGAIIQLMVTIYHAK